MSALRRLQFGKARRTQPHGLVEIRGCGAGSLGPERFLPAAPRREVAEVGVGASVFPVDA